MPLLDDLINYYVNLLIIQYHDKPKARATIALYVKELLANNLTLQLERAYDLETAVGPQLTVLGKYVGAVRVSRKLLIDRKYFQYTDYVSSPTGKIGYRRYDKPRIEGEVYFYSYQRFEKDPYTLTDAELKFCINFLIIKNNITSAFKDIKKAIFNFFGNDLLVFDNKNMIIVYFTNKDISNIIQIALSEDYLPRPIGTGLQVFSVKDPKKLFGYRRYSHTNPNTVGYRTYTTTKEGTMLRYSDIINI